MRLRPLKNPLGVGCLLFLSVVVRKRLVFKNRVAKGRIVSVKVCFSEIKGTSPFKIIRRKPYMRSIAILQEAIKR